MTIASVRVEYGEQPSAELLEAFNKAVIYGEQFKLNDEGKFSDHWTTRVVDLDMVPQGIKITVSELITHPSVQQLQRDRNPAYNQKVKVSVPGNGLMNIHRVKVVLDQCTEELQRQIDAGWCIIAVCPQPDQRRPDYILGTTRNDN